MVAGAGIYVLDLRVIAPLTRRTAITDLPQLPQLLDHLAFAALVGFLLVAFVLVATLVPLARGAASLLIPLLRPLRPSRSHRGIFPAGVCSQCGYDLRATPERCPECGTVSWRRR
jgi:hypothetical protein